MSVLEAVRSLGLWTRGELFLESTVPVMASPSWWGADSTHYSLTASEPDPTVRTGAGRTAFIKVMEPHTVGYIDATSAFAAARAAGDAGIGPKVHGFNAADGLLVMEDLTGVASTSTIDLFDDPDRMTALVELRRSVHRLPAFERVATVFDDLRSALAAARAVGADFPRDLDWFLRRLADAEKRITASGFDRVPCHGDGNVSNVMTLRDGALRLVDWDVAAMMDPLQDLGALLMELRPFDPEAREVFEMSWGHFDQGLFDRSRVYGLADCLRWGLIGAYCDAMRPGTHEYSKFADWQFLRARSGLGDPHFDDRVRNL